MGTFLDILTNGSFGVVHLGLRANDVYSLLGPTDAEITNPESQMGAGAQWGAFQIGWSGDSTFIPLEWILLEFHQEPVFPTALGLDLLSVDSALTTFQTITDFVTSHHILLVDVTPNYPNDSSLTWLQAPSGARLLFDEDDGTRLQGVEIDVQHQVKL